MYVSHLGFMDIIDFLKLIHNNELEQYIRDFRTHTHLCSPKEIMNKKQQCFYCLDCFRYAQSQVKEYKDYYKVKNKKYYKKDLEKEDD